MTFLKREMPEDKLRLLLFKVDTDRSGTLRLFEFLNLVLMHDNIIAAPISDKFVSSLAFFLTHLSSTQRSKLVLVHAFLASFDIHLHRT